MADSADGTDSATTRVSVEAKKEAENYLLDIGCEPNPDHTPNPNPKPKPDPNPKPNPPSLI